MKNKGFTLIELLAVIVILAIIALIATPIILGIINDAREQAKKRSAELVYTGAKFTVENTVINPNASGVGQPVASDATSFIVKTSDSAYCTVTVIPSNSTTNPATTYDVKVKCGTTSGGADLIAEKSAISAS